MIGTLKSKEVRTVRDKRVLRVTVDVPLGHARSRMVGDNELLPYLDHKVGEEIGFNITALENEGQTTLDLTVVDDE